MSDATDLDVRIRDAVAEATSMHEPAASPEEVLRRLEQDAGARPRRVGGRTLALVAIVILALGVTGVVVARQRASDRDQAPVDVGPAPTTESTVPPTDPPSQPTSGVPVAMPTGWHNWGTAPVYGSTPYVIVVPAGRDLVLVNDDGSGSLDPSSITAAALDLTTGDWRPLPAPSLGGGADAYIGGTATGDRAAFWAGTTIALFDPATGRWTTGSTSPSPLLGPGVWTGSELLFVADGLRYRPETDQWSTTAAAPSGTRWAATWDGHEVIAAGLVDESSSGSQAFAYDPATDHWRQLATPPLVGNALDLAWDGHRLVGVDYVLGAATYDPATDVWTALPKLPITPEECSVSVRPMGDTVMAQGCGGDVVLRGGAWTVVTDGRRTQGLVSVGAGVASFGLEPSTGPTQSTREDPTLWTYGP